MPSPPGSNLVENVRKIAVLRAGGLGDLIFTLPALDALREAYPEAEITLLGGPLQTELLSGRPEPVARALTVPSSTGVNGPDTGVEEDEEELERFFADMREEQFDLALQMHGGGGYSNPFVRKLEARVTAGARAHDAPSLDRTVPYVYFQSEILRYLEIASLVGARTAELEPRLQVTDEDLAEARNVVPEAGGTLVALHPGAGDSRRRWPPEKFAAVGDALAGADARVAVVGVEEDRALISGIVDAMEYEAFDLGGRLSLGGLAGLLGRCAVVVSNDSGPLHLAGALGATTVGIYWGPNFINAGPPNRARHRPALSWRSSCPVCGATLFDNDCGHAVSVVDDVPTDEVTGYALELLRNFATAPR
ncbi:MAG: ADP-heptose--lipooligosaccharide heptosyltransferase II [uncultured Rubrobacteraceae bacterium]|uniref:ADP-heptose--lipooligosaccharide heptosyltransferase II n=1 Tax=uncultured Rubrobacteraceae bacterium TaxID=349277 RepID=A0A6J4QQZ5_9ACTN|nr:MAG: ADP-heptose--lipooligosaccharide heptosyltransferase II [uncultured Rubrobacteraceae bacterium]